MSTPQHVDVSEAPHGHNVSAQHHAIENDDPALDRSHEHQHAHLHHDNYAGQGRKEELVYSEGTTFEKSTIPPQDPQDHDLARKRHQDPAKKATAALDAETGSMSPDRFNEEDPRTHTLSSFYARFRILFHLCIWLFFTGLVLGFSFRLL